MFKVEEPPGISKRPAARTVCLQRATAKSTLNFGGRGVLKSKNGPGAFFLQFASALCGASGGMTSKDAGAAPSHWVSSVWGGWWAACGLRMHVIYCRGLFFRRTRCPEDRPPRPTRHQIQTAYYLSCPFIASSGASKDTHMHMNTCDHRH